MGIIKYNMAKNMTMNGMIGVHRGPKCMDDLVDDDGVIE